MQLSEQQQAIVTALQNPRSGSIIVVARAGCGKTTTGVRICTTQYGSVAFVAYNRAIANEIGAKVKEAAPNARNVVSGTFHSFGLRAWRRAYPNVVIDERNEKWRRIFEQEDIDEEYRAFVAATVSMAKQRAIGVVCPIDDQGAWLDMVERYELDEKIVIDDTTPDNITFDMQVATGVAMAKRCLAASIALDRELIDFDDMIYAPLVHNVRVFQNDLVVIDEGQDTNPARRALAKRMLKPGGRLVAIGDPAQGIYGFTGADNDALDTIEREFGCRRLPLNVTYRCPKAVVKQANAFVADLVAHESAPEGVARAVAQAEFEKLGKDAFTVNDAVLCRNTKPLVELAFQLIRRGIAVHVEGRDIGAGLLALAKKWKSVTTIGDLRSKLEDHRKTEMARLMAKGRESQADSLNDRVETLLVLMEGIPDDEGHQMLARRINEIFEDTPAGQRPRTVTLSTVHRAKGREWDRVYLYGRNAYMPSPFARQGWQQQQEDNLVYVAITRAKRELIEVVLDIRYDRKPRP